MKNRHTTASSKYGDLASVSDLSRPGFGQDDPKGNATIVDPSRCTLQVGDKEVD